jgi:hypothetical protein
MQKPVLWRKFIYPIGGIILAGVVCFALAAVENAQAISPSPTLSTENSLLEQAICLACASQNTSPITQPSTLFQSQPSHFDPCDACHYSLSQAQSLSAEDKAKLLRAVRELQSRILTFSRTANAFQQQDARYQKAVANLWQAESAGRADSFLAVYALISQANHWLADLENEARSGFWRPSEKNHPIKFILVRYDSLKLKAVSLPLGTVFILIPPGEDQSLPSWRMVNPIPPVMLAIHRRGPPVIVVHMDSEITRRLSLGQSPLCFRMAAHMRGGLSLNAVFFPIRRSQSFVKEPAVVVQSACYRIGGYALFVVRN